MSCLLPLIESEEHDLKRRTSPIGNSNSPPPSPLTPVPRLEKSLTVDVIQYTVSDWLLFEKSVSPRFDQPLIKRNESFRQENQNNYRSRAIQRIYNYT